MDRLPLRERVAARKNGINAPKLTRDERNKRDKLYLLGVTLQIVGLIALIGYAWAMWETGFKTLNIWLVLAPSVVFLAGRGIHISLSIAKKRR